MAESRKKRLSFPEADILLPNHLTSYLLIKPDPRYQSEEVGRALCKIPGVNEVHMTAGKFGFLVKMRTRTKEECEREVRRLLLNPQISEVDALVGAKTFL